jgi:hypothetical protein
VFRRRHQTEPAPHPQTESAAAEPAQPAQPTPPKPGGKGRPTPKRSEAEKQRRARVNPPKDRREQAKQRREQMKAARRRQREGLARGEEKHLPARDRGPVRGFVRDYIDSRRTAAEFFLPGALTVLILGLVPVVRLQTISYLLFYVIIVTIVVNSTIVVRGMKKELSRRFPDEGPRGVTSYAVLRAMQLRRFRLPPPRVKPGDHI